VEVTTTARRLETDGLITNLGPDVLYVGDKNVTVETGYPVAVDASVSVARTEFAYGISEGTSEVVRLSGGTGVFPKGVDAPDLSGYQPLDSDLTAIAALSTTSYGRAFLTLANQAALVALLPSYQPLDSDLTAIAALTTTSYGRALLALADAAALGAAVGTEVFKQTQTINAQTGTTYTLVGGDAGKMVSLNNASGITLTLPQDSDATIAIGTYIDLYQLGAGQVTVAAGTGATLRVSGLTAKARAQYSRLAVQKVSANTWSLMGDLALS